MSGWAVCRVGLALWELLGPARALAILGRLRGRNVAAYRRRLRAVRVG